MARHPGDESEQPGAGLAAAQHLASFLPRLQVREIVSHAGEPPAPWERRLQAAVQFVDVAGFTPLTDRFAAQGARGAEQLSAVVDGCFGRVTEIVTAHGGDVLCFAGDAALVCWPATDAIDLAEAVRLAARSALEVQRELASYEPLPGIVLKLRTTVGAGELRTMEIGGTAGRWMFLATGEPIRDVAIADRYARAGGVVLTPGAWRQVSSFATATALEHGHVRLDAIPGPPRGGSSSSTPIRAIATALRSYVPRAVVERLEAGQAEWLAEFRNASLVFVGLGAGGRFDGESLDRVHAAAGALQRALDRYEGQVYQFLADDKGTSLIAAFGLPPAAHEDDPARAVEAALAMRDELQPLRIEASVGVATGRIFWCICGTDSRRQYGIFGSTINLAARLMQAARGGVLCDGATREAARDSGRLAFEPLPPMNLKGKSEPVAVHRPTRRRAQAAARAPVSGPPLVGRATERELLDSALREALDRRPPGAVWIEGEPGIGKSRLLGYLVDRAEQAGARTLTGAASALERDTPWFAWRPVIAGLLDLDRAPADTAARRAWLAHTLPEELKRLAPLLEPFLRLGLADDAFTARLEGEVRAENTRDLVVRLLQDGSDGRATVIALDDVHWLDSASRALALRIARQSPGVLLALAGRPIDEPDPEFSRLLELPATRRIRVAELETDETLGVVAGRLGVDALPAAAARLIEAKAAGHPLFAEELALALRDAGILRVEQGRCTVAPEVARHPAGLDGALREQDFPSTVQGVVTSRVDRIGAEQQLTLKVGSAIGGSFSLPILRDVFPVATDEARLRGWLDQLVQVDLLQRDPRATESGYAFRHALTQEVVYESMAYAQRRGLHRAVAQWYERAHRDDPAPVYALLARHWSRAEDAPKARRFLGLAGEQALFNHANAEAVRLLSEALELHERPSEVAPEDRGPDGEATGGQQARLRAEEAARLRLLLGKAYVNWSRHAEGRIHLERGLTEHGHRIARTTLGAATHCVRQLARQLLHRRFPARYAGREAHRAEALRRAALAYEGLTESYYLENRPLHCLAAAFHALNLAERAGPSPELARGFASLGAISGFASLHRTAEAYLARGLEVATVIEQPSALAWSALSAAVYHAGMGRWDDAGAHYEQAARIAEELGDGRRWDDSVTGLSCVRMLQGRFEDSLALADQCHRSATRRGDDRCRGGAVRNRAFAWIALDRLDDALAAAEELRSILAADSSLTELHHAALHALLAACHLHQSDHAAALAEADRAHASLGRSTPSFYTLLPEYAAVAEVYLTAESEPEMDADRSGRARRACRQLRRYARVFPVGRPLAGLWSGVEAWQRGRRRRARRLWDDALGWSRRLGLPYDEARIRFALGDRAGSESERGEHLRRALELFEAVGAARDVARTKHRLERRLG